MNSLFSTLRSFFNFVTGRQNEPNEVIVEAPCAVPRKRPQDENILETVTKKRKLDPENYLQSDFDSISLPKVHTMQQRHVKKNKTNWKKPSTVIDLTTPPHSTSNIQNIYCIDEDEIQPTQNSVLQKNALSGLKETNKWRKLNGNDQGSNFEDLSPSFMRFPSAMCKRSQLFLNRVHKEQEAATLLEMVKKYAPPSAFTKKSSPLTTSSMHNTNQNCSVNRSYSSHQMSLPSAKTWLSFERFEGKNDSTVIDLTADEGDESQRQIIEASVMSSPDIQNFKSSFVAKNCPMADPEYLVNLTKKYEQKRQNIGSRIQRLQKTIRDNNEEFCKTLAEVLEKRLSIKDVGESEVEQKPSWEIAPITTDMIAEIKKILNSGKEPLAKIKNEEVKYQDILTLDNFSWLNDAVINSYMNLIQLRAENNPDKYPKVHCFNTFLYPALKNRGYCSVRRWTRRVDIFAYPIIIIPIHQGGNHWCLVQVQVNEQRILYYNSLGSPNTACLETILQYLVDEYKDKKNSSQNKDDWTLINVPADEIPKQMNAYDCGVFTCTYAEHITRNSPFNFDQEHMPYFRLKMKYEILTGSLLL